MHPCSPPAGVEEKGGAQTAASFQSHHFDDYICMLWWFGLKTNRVERLQSQHEDDAEAELSVNMFHCDLIWRIESVCGCWQLQSLLVCITHTQLSPWGNDAATTQQLQTHTRLCAPFQSELSNTQTNSINVVLLKNSSFFSNNDLRSLPVSLVLTFDLFIPYNQKNPFIWYFHLIDWLYISIIFSHLILTFDLCPC